MYQDAVNIRIGIQVADLIQQFGFTDCFFVVDQGGFETHFLTGFYLGRHISGTGPVITHQDRRQVWYFFPLCIQLGYFYFQFVPDSLGCFFTV